MIITISMLPNMGLTRGDGKVRRDAEGAAGQLQRIFPDGALPAAHVRRVEATRQLPERVRLPIAYLTEQLADGTG